MQGGLSCTRGLLIRGESESDSSLLFSSLFHASAVTITAASPRTWNVYFYQGSCLFLSCFLTEHLCDAPERQLRLPDQRSRKTGRRRRKEREREREREKRPRFRWWRHLCQPLGLWVMRLSWKSQLGDVTVPRWTSTIKDSSDKRQGRARLFLLPNISPSCLPRWWQWEWRQLLADLIHRHLCKKDVCSPSLTTSRLLFTFTSCFPDRCFTLFATHKGHLGNYKVQLTKLPLLFYLPLSLLTAPTTSVCASTVQSLAFSS